MVIAIIGILSGVVLASLNLARSKGADAKIKAQLASARTAAELYFDKNSSYNGSAGDIDGTILGCDTLDSMFTDVDSGMAEYTNPNNYPNPVSIDLRCSSFADSFVISGALVPPANFGALTPPALLNGYHRSTVYTQPLIRTVQPVVVNLLI